MVIFLDTLGHTVNCKRVQRLMREMGLAGMASDPTPAGHTLSTKSTPTELAAELGTGNPFFRLPTGHPESNLYDKRDRID